MPVPTRSGPAAPCSNRSSSVLRLTSSPLNGAVERERPSLGSAKNLSHFDLGWRRPTPVLVGYSDSDIPMV
jgi:hypothetical protein